MSERTIDDIVRPILGVRFARRGVSIRTGFDCRGFVLFVYARMGLDVAIDPAWYRVPVPVPVGVSILNMIPLEPAEKKEPGNLIALCWGRAWYANHLAIRSETGIAHVHKRVVNHAMPPSWEARIRGEYTWRR